MTRRVRWLSLPGGRGHVNLTDAPPAERHGHSTAGWQAGHRYRRREPALIFLMVAPQS